ncbi:hypothetical protein AVEN_96196-1 [Araneus ventricosus]|uniref:Uncharacterized protein n=1 Tax=Araneus ventricosus TaxID=182803 RepID=A0A4Y2FSI3_ARAVE|nr:hypothetical protein AVEN_96196-1 [Araneus ventricosus]
MTRTTPELAPPSPNFHATPTGGHLTTTYNLTCNRPHTRRIFCGVGSRTWNPPAPKPSKEVWRGVAISGRCGLVLGFRFATEDSRLKPDFTNCRVYGSGISWIREVKNETSCHLWRGSLDRGAMDVFLAILTQSKLRGLSLNGLHCCFRTQR